MNYREGYSDAMAYAISTLEDFLFQWEEELDPEAFKDLGNLVTDLYKAKNNADK